MATLVFAPFCKVKVLLGSTCLSVWETKTTLTLQDGMPGSLAPSSLVTETGQDGSS